MWQTTAVAVRADEEGFLIDSPVHPDELDALPSVLEQASFPVSGLLATHGDWDHLLGRLAFPEASLGCGRPTAERLAAEPGAAQRALRDFDAEYYVDGRRALALAGVQELPVPGKLELGDVAGTGPREIELHPASGHTADGTAFVLTWLEAVICGDYLSPVEIPMISPGGSLELYLDTLGRLEGLVGRSRHVVPGHGGPLEREEALRVLAEDRAYLESLREHGAQAELPPGRRSGTQRGIHAGNVERLGGATRRR